MKYIPLYYIVTKRIEERLNGKLGLNLKLTDKHKTFSDNLNAVSK